MMLSGNSVQVRKLDKQKKEYGMYHTKLVQMMNDENSSIDDVLEMLDKALEKHKDNIFILCAQANILLHVESYKESIQILDEVIKLCPSHSEAYALKGTALMRWRKFSESFEFLSNAAKKFPANEQIVTCLLETKAALNRISNSKARGMQKLWSQQFSDTVESMSVHPLGSLLAVALIEGLIKIVDASTGIEVKSLPGHSNGNLVVSFSPSGGVLATSGQDGLVNLYSVPNFDKIISLNHKAQGKSVWVQNIIWISDELIITSSGKNLQSWNLEGQIVQHVVWNAALKLLATASYSTIALFSLSQNIPVRVAEWKGSLLSLSWSFDGNYLAASTQDNSVIVWNTESNGVFPLSDYDGPVTPYFAPNTKLLITTGGDLAKMWNFSGPNSPGFEDRPESTMLPVVELAHDKQIEDISFHKTGKLMCSSSQDGVTYIWRTQQDTPLGVAKYSEGVKSSLWIENNGKNFVCIVYKDGNVISWNL